MRCALIYLVHKVKSQNRDSCCYLLSCCLFCFGFLGVAICSFTFSKVHLGYPHISTAFLLLLLLVLLFCYDSILSVVQGPDDAKLLVYRMVGLVIKILVDHIIFVITSNPFLSPSSNLYIMFMTMYVSCIPGMYEKYIINA